MPNSLPIEELERSTDAVAVPRAPSLQEAREYCRRLALRHCENFTVASWLLPKRLRPHFYAIYAYCRCADDLADETGDPQRSLELLDGWQAQLDDCYRGRARHPVFVALAATIEEFSIPATPFAQLLTAFRQDQWAARYATFDDVLAYCRNSAHPVGQLVLYLGRCYDAERAELSDSICTGLQLANFLQDVAGDWRRGRVYLPLEHCRRAGYTEAMFERGEPNDAFRSLMSAEVATAERYLKAGLPLVDLVPQELRVDVALFALGGLAILDRIRGVDYNVWTRRPRVSKGQQLRLLARAWWRTRHKKPFTTITA